MASYDRTEGGLAKMLSSIWPQLLEMSSLEVQDFLNTETGCNVTIEPNPEAFDIWRQALAKHPERAHVWPYSQEYLHKVQVRAREMKADEEERQRKLADKADDSR